MNICHDMGRPAGCQEWIEQLYDAYISFLGQTLPEVSDARAALGVMPGFGGGPKPPPARQGCRSFSANTKVLMADGTTKPIDKVRVGDQVMATDPETGEQGPRKVTHRWVHDDKLTDLVLNDGTVITTTEDHPFWNATDHQWQPADALSPGDRLLGNEGQHTAVIGIRLGPALPAPAYNLTIDDIHTYYVLAGNTPILVHNEGVDDYNQAMKKALGWLEKRGFVAERTTIGKFGATAGQPIGMQTADGKAGFRVEFDERNGAHINVWSGKEKGPHFKFDASGSTVTKIQRHFGCK